MFRDNVRLIAFLGGFALLAAGCDPGTTPPDDQARWQQPLSDLPGGLLSVSGTSATNVYAVGADGDGNGPMVVHYDGTDWTRLDTDAVGDLWWISDRPIGDAFFMVGEAGLILRFDRTMGTFEQYPTPADNITLYGIWGTQENNLVAVGGDPNNPDPSGVIWRFNGQEWTAEDVTDIDPLGIPVLFKVWGRSASEIYACGARGIVLRYDGAAWTEIPTPTTRTLFTIHGNADRVVACGGIQTGVIIELQGDAFVDVTPVGAVQMNGTFSAAGGDSVTVGQEGAVAWRRATNWDVVDTGLNLDPLLSYHATWIDPAGGVWAVGGNLVSEPAVTGLLSYYGVPEIRAGLSQD